MHAELQRASSIVNGFTENEKTTSLGCLGRELIRARDGKEVMLTKQMM